MNCPFCGNEKTRVISTTSWLEREILRVRLCCKCKGVFKTVEAIDQDTIKIIHIMQREKRNEREAAYS